MIQTLLIILFIVVPIFLLLDKVTTGVGRALDGQEGSHRASQTWAGSPSRQHLCLPSGPSSAPGPTLWLTCSLTLQLFLEGTPCSPPPPLLSPSSPCPQPSPAWPSKGWGEGTLPLTPPFNPPQDDSKAGMEEDHTYEVRNMDGTQMLWAERPVAITCWFGQLCPGLSSISCLQGLDIDQTATYEDIVTLRTGEVKWSVGEHPGQE